MIAGRSLFRCEHGDHVHARSADAYRKESAPAAGVQIDNLVVHDVAAGLPECLPRNHFPRLLTLEFEEDLAVQYVTENRSGVPMWREPSVCWREFDELRHRMRTLGYPRGSDAQKICDLRVSCGQHVHSTANRTATPGVASRASVTQTARSEFLMRSTHPGAKFTQVFVTGFTSELPNMGCVLSR